MSHPAVLAFFSETLRSLRSAIPNGCRVLEIGSYDVNGSIRNTVSAAIGPSEYVGVDLTPGPGVDVVCSGHQLKLPDGTFDITLSAECLEHNPHWEDTLRNMRRLTKFDGYVVVSCATLGRLEHGTTRTNPKSSPGTQSAGWDYYRNLTAKDFPKDLLDSFVDKRFWVNTFSKDLYFIGSVSKSLPATIGGQESFLRIKPHTGAFTKATLDIPLAILRSLLSEQRYQDAGVALLSMRTRMRDGLALRRSNK